MSKFLLLPFGLHRFFLMSLTKMLLCTDASALEHGVDGYLLGRMLRCMQPSPLVYVW
jgi:hypothetical protein